MQNASHFLRISGGSITGWQPKNKSVKHCPALGNMFDLHQDLFKAPHPRGGVPRKAFKTHYLTPLKIAFGVWALWAPIAFFFFFLAMPSPRPGAKKKKTRTSLTSWGLLWGSLGASWSLLGTSWGLLRPPRAPRALLSPQGHPGAS